AQRLADLLRSRHLRSPLVLAIPRGGVVLGAVLARELGAELDIVLSRKLRAPGNEEVAIGALAEDGEVYFNQYAEENKEAWAEHLVQEVEHQRREIARRQALYRAIRPQAPVADRT